MLKTWQKLVFNQLFLFSDNFWNLGLPLHRTKQNEKPICTHLAETAYISEFRLPFTFVKTTNI